MSYGLNSLKGDYIRIIADYYRVIKGDTRRLYNGSYKLQMKHTFHHVPTRSETGEAGCLLHGLILRAEGITEP